jgi:hypothetical protein
MRPIECEGAPRDLGFDQGSQCREALRAAFARLSKSTRVQLRLGGSREIRRLRRDIRRYCPRQSELLEALARAAGVPIAWLASELEGGASADFASRALGACAVARSRAGAALLARSLPDLAILRRSRPESGFGSLELTLPGRVEPLAGVNEAGLAVVWLGDVDRGAAPRRAPPASLLAHDCLARFDGVEAAIEWLLVRPGAGASLALLADATGECAGVRIDGGSRSVLRPDPELIVHCSVYERKIEIEKRLREAPSLPASQLARSLALPLVVVEPQRRAIGMLGADDARVADGWFAI